MITPEQFKQIIEGLTDLDQRVEASPGKGMYPALMQELRRLTAEFVSLSKEPIPEYMREDFLAGQIADAESLQGSIIAAMNAPRPPLEKQIVDPWDFVAVEREMVEGLELRRKEAAATKKSADYESEYKQDYAPSTWEEPSAAAPVVHKPQPPSPPPSKRPQGPAERRADDGSVWRDDFSESE